MWRCWCRGTWGQGPFRSKNCYTCNGIANTDKYVTNHYRDIANIKKILISFLFLFVVFVPIKTIARYEPICVASASEEEFEEILDDQLDNLDTNEIDKIINDLDGQTKDIFGEETFMEKIKKILSGDLGEDSSTILNYILNLLFDDLLAFLPLISLIISIAILGSIVQGLKAKTHSSSVSNIINFVVYGLIITIIFSVFGKLISMAVGVIGSIQKQMNAIFPILLTLLTSVGGAVSVGVYQPAMAVLSTVVINIFKSVLFPIFIFSSVLIVVSNLSNSIKLDKMVGFLNSVFKWLVGIVFSVFLGFAAFKGLTAGSIDGLSIKTAKFTFKSYIPIVGGYMSDGVFLMLAGCNLIKNAVGFGGLVLMFASIISPIISIIVFMLCLKFVAAVVEPLGNGKLASLISGLAKNLQMLVAMVAAVSFMYVILVGLVMCSANIV